MMPDRLEEMIRAPWCFASEDISEALAAVMAERDKLAAALRIIGVDPDKLSSHETDQ